MKTIKILSIILLIPIGLLILAWVGFKIFDIHYTKLAVKKVFEKNGATISDISCYKNASDRVFYCNLKLSKNDLEKFTKNLDMKEVHQFAKDTGFDFLQKEEDIVSLVPRSRNFCKSYNINGSKLIYFGSPQNSDPNSNATCYKLSCFSNLVIFYDPIDQSMCLELAYAYG